MTAPWYTITGGSNVNRMVDVVKERQLWESKKRVERKRRWETQWRIVEYILYDGGVSILTSWVLGE